MSKTDTKSPGDTLPDALRPFQAYGLALRFRNATEASADCPFCLKEDKFWVNAGSGEWHCFTCSAGAEKGNGKPGGNIYTFMRCLHALAVSKTTPGDYEALRKDRKLLSAETLAAWGVCRSPVDGRWLVPAYGADLKLNGLYRYVKIKDKSGRYKARLLPAPGLNHHLHLHADSYSRDKPEVYLCEGPWDGMALWETLRYTRLSHEVSRSGAESVAGTVTGNPDSCGLAEVNVVAAPGANVFSDHWLPLFAGKTVTMFYDSDRPGERGGQPGLDGMKRVTAALALGSPPAEKAFYLSWGPHGYDPSLPSGADVRDVITARPDRRGRAAALGELLTKVRPVGPEWLAAPAPPNGVPGALRMEPLPCGSWQELTAACRKALLWTDGLDTTFAVMLAAVASTRSLDELLWVRVLGRAASGKSTLCAAVSAAHEHVVAKSTFRGFHSGYKSDATGKEDHSLLNLLRDKTLVVKDGDTLLQAPNLGQILSEARDLYDRTSATHYRHGVNRDYNDIRMTFILCGTSSLRALDTSELGERFLTVNIMGDIDPAFEDRVLLRKMRQAFRSGKQEGNGKPESQHPEDMARMMRLTAGYVNHLRKNAARLADAVETPDEEGRYYIKLARYVSYMRARPSARQHEVAEREMATRLVAQFCKLGLYLAVVLNRPSTADAQVRVKVRKVALASSEGRVLRIVRKLHSAGRAGAVTADVAASVAEADDDTRKLLVFMRKIKMAEQFAQVLPGGVKSLPRWRLSAEVRELYEEINGE